MSRKQTRRRTYSTSGHEMNQVGQKYGWANSIEREAGFSLPPEVPDTITPDLNLKPRVMQPKVEYPMKPKD